jgi:hypothetical protein
VHNRWLGTRSLEPPYMRGKEAEVKRSVSDLSPEKIKLKQGLARMKKNPEVEVKRWRRWRLGLEKERKSRAEKRREERMNWDRVKRSDKPDKGFPFTKVT